MSGSQNCADFLNQTVDRLRVEDTTVHRAKNTDDPVRLKGIIAWEARA